MNLTQDEDNQPTEAVPDPEQLHQELRDFSFKFKEAISGVIIGQEAILDQLVVALFCRGHVLITGVPGLAKTLLIRSLAQLFHLQFNRIQCTPDLMPSDITGVEILEESGNNRKFRFIPGPVFTNLLLADEINRTSPRTVRSKIPSSYLPPRTRLIRKAPIPFRKHSSIVFSSISTSGIPQNQKKSRLPNSPARSMHHLLNQYLNLD